MIDLESSSAERASSTSLFVQAKNFIRRLRGGSQALLIEADDGLYYVVKVSGNPQGSNVLANELIGSVLARAAGLPVAANAFVSISRSFLEQNADLALQSRDHTYGIQPGLHFGSRFIGDVSGPKRPLEFLSRTDLLKVENRSDFLGMLLFDVLTNHQDNRQAIFVRNCDSTTLKAVFIDFGHLCGGPEWNRPPSKRLAYHLQTSIYSGLWSNRVVSSWVETFLNTIPQALALAISLMPASWFKGDIALLETSLLARLSRHHDWTDADNIPSVPFYQGTSPYESLRVQDPPVRHL